MGTSRSPFNLQTRRSLRLAVRAAALLMPLALGAPQSGAAAETPASEQGERRYDIPAGSLSAALSRFAGEAGVLLSVDGRRLEGLESGGLHGSYGVDAGFAELLRGSRFRAQRDARGNYTLVARESSAAAGTMALDAMEVEGFSLGNALGSTDGYNATHSSVATKTSMALVETSQTVSVVTRKQMDDQGARTVAQALRYTPGLMSSPYGSTSRYDYVAMRGINDGSVDNLYLDGLKVMGDSGTYSSLQVDQYFIERIDVLKGPSSVLYGRSLPGGLVAMTSKKPQREAKRQLQFSYGSQGYKQGAFDFTGPLTDRIAYRLVGVAKDAGYQVSGIDSERYALMPSLSFDFTDDTRLTLQALLQHDPSSGYHGGLPAEGTVTRYNGKRISRSFFEGDKDHEKFERHQKMIGYQLEHRFNDVVSARQNFNYVDSKVNSEQIYQYGYADTSGDLSRYYTGAKEDLHAWTIDNQLQFEFDTGPLQHTLVTGLDYQRRWSKVRYDSGTVSSINPWSDDRDYSFTSEYHLYDESRHLEQTGLYAQDLISLGNWRFSVGLREDWIDVSFKQTESVYGDQSDRTKAHRFTQRYGVLYAFDNGFSPYFSYSQSFNPNTSSAYNYNSSSGGYSVTLLKPTEGEQYEVGLKYQPPGTDDLYTVSLFHLTESNLSSKDSSEYFYRSVGEITSKGVEFEARFKPLRNLNVLASYTYMDVDYTRDYVGTAGVNDRGNTPPAVAKHMASLWADYGFDYGPLVGLQVGAGVRYFGRSWADSENTLRIPSYTLYDASASYDLTQIGLKGVGLRLSANNLTDKKYVSACSSLYQCYYGEARNLMGTVTYDF